MIKLELHSSIAELTIQHAKPQNPFTMQMTRQLREVSQELEADDRVNGVLLWGGEDRSFSVGGDFAEVSQLTDEASTHRYAREIIDSYQAVLGISKPVVVAIDRYAIGLGLQVALMSDWRVGTTRSICQMPELKGGLACPMGSMILDRLFGRARMLELVIGCEGVSANDALGFGLLQEVCSPAELRNVAIERLAHFAAYPALPFRLTKQRVNAIFSAEFEALVDDASKIHWQCFEAGQANQHFGNILGAKR